MKKVLSNKLYILLFTAPALLLFIGFVLYPLVNTVIMSFQNTDGLSSTTFIGLDNFTRLMNDNNFKSANISSLLLSVLAVVGDAVLGIATAIFIVTLEKKVQKIFRTAFLIPMVLSISVISQLWLAIYHAEWGLLNSVLGTLGLSKLQNQWLINDNTAMICIAIVGMWWIFGLMVLLAYSGLKTIPEQYLEAAKIDGANYFQTIFKITLPLLAEVSKVCVILAAVGGLYTFPQVYIMTGGGPGNLTETVMMFMYKQVFSNMRFGLGSAVAVIVIIETFLIITVVNRTMARKSIQY